MPRGERLRGVLLTSFLLNGFVNRVYCYCAVDTIVL